MLQKAYKVLASKKLAIALFAVICIVSIPGTFMEERDIYSDLASRVLLGLMGLNLSFCTLRRWKSLPGPVIIMHAGGTLILAGSLISSFGFVATVNISEGTSTDKVYRWDTKEDTPLGLDLSVKKINIEHYPLPVKVGVRKGKEKVGLFELKTGGSFNLENFRIRVDSIEFPAENLKLSLFDKEQPIGSVNTVGDSSLPRDFPYEFVLVAFKDPVVKRVRVDLALNRDAEIIAEGVSEVNGPFKWKDLRFYNTSIDRDKYGFLMAGIQIVRDPGRPFVYFGFCILGLGAAAYLLRRLQVGKR